MTAEPKHDAYCDEWCNHCTVCGQGTLYGSLCSDHRNVPEPLPEVPVPTPKTQVRACDAQFVMVCFGIPRSIFDLFYDVIPDEPFDLALEYLSELDHRLYCEGALS